MNTVHAFNQTIQYVEGNLRGVIAPEMIEKLSLCPNGLFQRLFPMMTGISFSEYIRYRKLSEAAKDLRQLPKKVIDVSLDYGYDSADAFGQAFKRFHGATPSEVKKGAAYRFFPAIKFSIAIQGGPSMNVKIVQKPAFSAAGIIRAGKEGNFDELWKQLYAERHDQQLQPLGNGQPFGVCIPREGTGEFDYLAGYHTNDMETAKNYGYETVHVDAAEYVIAQCTGKVPECIQHAWQYLVSEFFPSTGYQPSGAPDLEVYSNGDVESETYQMELWVPVKQ